MVKKILKAPRKAYQVIRKDGLTIFLIKLLEKFYRRSHPGSAVKLQSLAKIEDIMQVDWSAKTAERFKPGPNKKKSFTINWVMSPPGKGSGGHQNLFRFIRYAEQAGHTCRIYLYSTIDHRSLEQIREVLDDSYPRVKATIAWEQDGMKPADAIFATGWETAYPVFNSKVTAKRFYFVQDFEPYFSPVGSEYVFAENTYRFGFHGITAGGWLAHKLKTDYDMETGHYDFGADTSLYRFTNKSKRKEIFFYARPVTARRGFELGIMALAEFHKRHPDYTITLAGWDVSEHEIPFPYVNLRSKPLNELSDVYNNCAAALVISLTNMSLLPLELLSCGVIPVVNDAPNNRMVSDNPYIAYTPNNPLALADRLSEIVQKKDLPTYAKKAADSVVGNDWDASGKRFVDILEKGIRHG